MFGTPPIRASRVRPQGGDTVIRHIPPFFKNFLLSAKFIFLLYYLFRLHFVPTPFDFFSGPIVFPTTLSFSAPISFPTPFRPFSIFFRYFPHFPSFFRPHQFSASNSNFICTFPTFPCIQLRPPVLMHFSNIPLHDSLTIPTPA
jgi:hypothetical protein